MINHILVNFYFCVAASAFGPSFLARIAGAWHLSAIVRL
jgi:hypothetical protein